MLKNPLYGLNSYDNSALIQSLSGKTSLLLSADTTLAVANHSLQVGKYIEIAADAKTLTLPAVVVGASFIIVNTANDGESLLTISPNASDKFLVDIAGAAGTDNKDIILAKATQKQHDFVHLIGLSADGWLIHNVAGVWSDQA
tara:strand:+ start:432 stop:860 length:429 start_codon:yes stop_codon:yes gene_type:complete